MKCQACGKDADMLIGGACSWACHDVLYPKNQPQENPAWETEKTLRQILGRVYRLADGWYAEVLRIEASQGHSPYSAALAKCSGELLRALGFENVDEPLNESAAESEEAP